MAIDIGILGIMVLSALYGYGQGFTRGLSSFICPVLGIWLALRKCDAFATILDPIIHNYTFSVVVSFLIIFFATWLGIRLVRNLLMKLVNWNRCLELNQFLGGFLGLAKATVFVWLILALSLTIVPQSVCVIEKSKASVRLLALGESITGQAMSRGKGIVRLEDSFEDPSGTVGQHLGAVRHYTDALTLLKHRYELPAPGQQSR